MNYMNIFTIVTTILGLLLSIYSCFKKENPIYNGYLAVMKDTTIIVPPSIQTIIQDENAIDKTTLKNYKFINEILYKLILVLVLVVFGGWIIYGWNTLSIIEDNPLILVNFSRLYQSMFFALFNTVKCTLPLVTILSFGLVFKNFKNTHNAYRKFHMVTYGLLGIMSAINFIVIFFTKYTWFMPKTNVSISTNILPLKTILLDLLISEAPMLLIAYVFLIVYCIYKLIHGCIWGEYKSRLLRKDCNHITERILFNVGFILFLIYMIFLIQHFVA